MADAQLTRLGRYHILEELGRGAMGIVYVADDSMLNRKVAVKTILLAADAEERAEYEARFYQEAKAAGGLNHPNIVTIHDIGREGDVAYMAMELLEGTELREMMKSGLSPRQALHIAAQVADGLAFAHQNGVVHRDIKPANIMVLRGEHAKVMDFGIARMRLSDVKTQVGTMMGSPRYMSPEQIAGERADHRSDIFSLGVTIYETVTGQPPFSAPDLSQLMYEVSTAAPRPASAINPALPPMLDLVLAKALEKDPQARYQSAQELAADLRACLASIAADADARGAATVPKPALDLELSSTAVLQPGAEKTVLAGDASRTLKLGSTVVLPRKLQLAPSPRFDSSRALQRLAHSQAGTWPQRHFFSDPYRRNLALLLGATAIFALLIALA